MERRVQLRGCGPKNDWFIEENYTVLRLRRHVLRPCISPKPERVGFESRLQSSGPSKQTSNEVDRNPGKKPHMLHNPQLQHQDYA